MVNSIKYVLVLTCVLAPIPVVCQGSLNSARKAVTSFKNGEKTAGRDLLKARRTHPIIGTALAVLEAESLLQRGRFKQAEQRALWVMDRDPRWVHRAAWIAGLAALEKDCERALRYFESVRVDPPWVRHAKLLSAKRDALAKCGNLTAARVINRRLYKAFPGHETGARAANPTPGERLARAGALRNARRYGDALTVLENVIKEGTLKHAAHFERGRLQLDFMRTDFDAALKDFTTVCNGSSIHTEEGCFFRGKTLGRKGDLIGALDAYDQYLGKYPSGKYADESRFFSAFLLYENGRYKKAKLGFKALTTGRWSGPALWYQAWSSYLGKDYGKALQGFQHVIETGKPLSPVVRKAQYWAIRIVSMTDPAEGFKRAEQMVRELPHDWYGLLLRRRYVNRFLQVPALTTVTGPINDSPDAAFAHQIKEIRALHDAGLPDFARRALAYLAPRIRAAGLYRLETHVALQIGDARRALLSALSRDTGFIKYGPRDDFGHRWRAAYPLGFKAMVDAVAQTEQVDPTDVLTFIRKESAFHPDAVSRAHAVGLMQLLPKTAEKILRSPNFPKDELPPSRLGSSAMERLFEPAVNLRLGAWYVAKLSERFAGQKPLIAAAYNAGPVALIQWIGHRVAADTDEFVERIPFREAREYVKKWMSTRVVYDVVHGGVDLERAVLHIPLKLDLRVKAGVHF